MNKLFAMTQRSSKETFDAMTKIPRYGIYGLIIALTVAGLFQYTGDLYIYLLFSVVSNALLYLGFRKNAIFFDAFIGIFFWLGFWLKLTIRVSFMDGLFQEAVGEFNGTGSAFDHALLVSSCGMLGLITASIVREKIIFGYPMKTAGYKHNGILNIYKDYRNSILICFAFLFISVALTNIYFGIYQKGEITQTILPLGLNGIYKWLLLFGLASVSAVILQCELIIKMQLSYRVIILSLLESFSTNVSLLSRGMILNSFALAYGVYASLRINSIKLNLRVLATSFLIFSILFVSSVYVVNYIRSSTPTSTGSIDGVNRSLLLDRWVGIEGVMAVSSNHKVGSSLWQDAWKEIYSENGMSFYDKNLIISRYENTDFTKKHSVSLPGVLAFFFYPGSFSFLFVCMFLLGLLAALVEISAFKLGGNNLILCSLVAEVVAYRFVSFGYVPAQSYLLFGTIFLNLFIIYFLDRFLGVWRKLPQ